MNGSDQVLCRRYELVMLDLDGVVYVGGDAVPGAADGLAAARAAGARLAFVTNNASRSPRAVAQHLSELGVEAGEQDVVTSAQAAAHLLADALPGGAKVFLLGADGLAQALRERGLTPVTDPDDEPAAVVSGYGPDLTWGYIMRGALLIRSGVPWVASNTDTTIPTPQGVGPGHGVLVKALAEYADVEPRVAGKPSRALFDEALERKDVGRDRALMVGDRVDTDIDGAQAAGLDSLLVMSGITDLEQLLGLGDGHRPTFLAWDLGGLTRPHGRPEVEDGVTSLGGWRAQVDGGEVRVGGEGGRDDWLRAVAAAAWAHTDGGGDAPRGVVGEQPPER